MSHIEVIKPNERLSLGLGETGYLPPADPSSIEDLAANLKIAKRQLVGLSVWKLKRESNSHPRRLTLPNGKRLACKVIGGTGRDWWFVSISVADGLHALSLVKKVK